MNSNDQQQQPMMMLTQQQQQSQQLVRGYGGPAGISIPVSGSIAGPLAGNPAWLSLSQNQQPNLDLNLKPVQNLNQSWPGPIFPKPNLNLNLNQNQNQRRNNNNHWKSKKSNRRTIQTGSTSGTSGAPGSYKPPTLHELQTVNRLKARRYFPNKNKKFKNANANNNNVARFAPYAPRNTSSFIIRAKKSGGIAELVSPCPVTPAVLTTPSFSPSKEDLVDTAEAEWGVDGYGSMNGLIRLRETGDNDEEEDGDGSSGDSGDSEVEEHVEVERRLDHDLSRFEMIYPNEENENEHENGGESENGNNGMQVDRQDTHIAHLEEENLTLRERLFLMETEMADLRSRLLRLERSREENQNQNEASGENDGADGCGDICSEKSVGDVEGEGQGDAGF